MADGVLVTRDFVKRASRAIRKSEQDPAVGRRTRRVHWPDGGFPMVRFAITTPDCTNHKAEAVVTAVSCGAGDPQIGDTITVYDGTPTTADGWFSGETDSPSGGSLAGRTGIAHKFNVEDGDDPCSYSIVVLFGGGLSCT